MRRKRRRAIDRVFPVQDACDMAVAIVGDRLKLLSEIARHRIESPVTAGHRIAAIAEINAMEGSYPPERHLIAGEVVLRIVRDDPPASTSSPASSLEQSEQARLMSRPQEVKRDCP